jgi:hypothetical protein
MDDTEVLFTYQVNGKPQFDNLAFVAYSELKDEDIQYVVVLGSMSAAIERLKAGTLKHPDGRKLGDEGIDLSGDNSE